MLDDALKGTIVTDHSLRGTLSSAIGYLRKSKDIHTNKKIIRDVVGGLLKIKTRM